MHICEAKEVFVFAESIRFLALMAYVRFCSGIGYSGVWVVSVVGGWWIEQTDNQTWWNHILLSNKESLIWNTCNICYSEGNFVVPCRKIHFLHNYRISAWKCPWQKNIDRWKILKTGDTGYTHNFSPPLNTLSKRESSSATKHNWKIGELSSLFWNILRTHNNSSR